MNLLYRAKKNFFTNISISSITNNNFFLKIVKRFFSDKISQEEKVNLVEHYAILRDDHVVAYTSNSYFNKIIETLLTLTNKTFSKKKTNGFTLNLIEAVISKYDTHLSLTLIWVGYLEVRFEVRGRGKITPCLKPVRIMIETSNLARKYTLICSFRKYTF